MTIELKKVIFSLSKVEREVLPYIDETSIEEISKKSNLKLSESTTAIQLLEQRKIVEIHKNEEEIITLDKFGEEFLKNGLPEIQLLNSLNGKAKKLSELNLDQSIVSSAMGELKKKQALRRKVVSASIYPLFIIISTVGITIMLTVFVFPRIIPIFEGVDAPLPWSTRF